MEANVDGVWPADDRDELAECMPGKAVVLRDGRTVVLGALFDHEEQYLEFSVESPARHAFIVLDHKLVLDDPDDNDVMCLAAPPPTLEDLLAPYAKDLP